jgi:hypothetical protein
MLPASWWRWIRGLNIDVADKIAIHQNRGSPLKNGSALFNPPPVPKSKVSEEK